MDGPVFGAIGQAWCLRKELSGLESEMGMDPTSGATIKMPQRRPTEDESTIAGNFTKVRGRDQS